MLNSCIFLSSPLTSRQIHAALMALTKEKNVPNGNPLDAVYVYPNNSPERKQQKTLRKILRKARDTEFGKLYHFDRMLTAKYNVGLFQKNVPITDYEHLYLHWWKRMKRGDRDTCWPGKIQYFALTSGTTEGASKFIPVSKHMLRSVLKTSLRQYKSLRKSDIPKSVWRKEVLLIGGSTKLEEKNGRFFGDMSGIQAKNILPAWFANNQYRPGYDISNIEDWSARVDAIIKHAHKWDIGIICGMPNWITFILQRLVDAYELESIHELWPNLSVYIHGGVYLDPYRAQLSKLFGKPMFFAETYMASEGFFGYSTPASEGELKLATGNGVFYEFIPANPHFFNDKNLPIPDAPVFTIADIKPNVDYAVIISNNAGAWRYLIGDIVRFSNTSKGFFRITGRLKHTINMCGEHVSGENLRVAFTKACEKLNIVPGEFTVAPMAEDQTFFHLWVIAGPKSWSQLALSDKLDKILKSINDDYRVARSANLEPPRIVIVRNHVFSNWMSIEHKAGNQNQLPLVLSANRSESLLKFIRYKHKMTRDLVNGKSE